MQSGQIRNKIGKSQNPTAGRCGSKSRVLSMIPVLSTANVASRLPKPPLPVNSPILHYPHQHTPYLRNQPTFLLHVFTPLCYSLSPNKTLPEFPVWPLVNFYWLNNPRTLVGNIWKRSKSQLFLGGQHFPDTKPGKPEEKKSRPMSFMKIDAKFHN